MYAHFVPIIPYVALTLGKQIIYNDTMKLTIRDLELSYFGHLPSLHGIDATFDEGVSAILGTTGSGKTSLLKSIAGLTPYEGEIALDGEGLQHERQADVGMVFDDLGLFGRRSAYYNLTYPLKVRRIPKSEWGAYLEPALKTWGLQDLFLDTAARRLSKPIQVKLALARAWLLPRKVLLLDDPLSFLSPDEREETFALLSRNMRKREGITVYATNHVREVRSLNVPTLLLSYGYNVGTCLPKDGDEVASVYQGQAFVHGYQAIEGVCREGKAVETGLPDVNCDYPASYEGQRVLVGVSPDYLRWVTDDGGDWSAVDYSLDEGVRYTLVQNEELYLTIRGELPLGEKGRVEWVRQPDLFDPVHERRLKVKKELQDENRN